MPNVIAAQPNIGGALCGSSVIPFLVPRRKVWLMPVAGLPCSNAANIGERKTWTWSDVTAVTLPRPKTRWSLLGCPKLPNRSQPLVGRSSPYCGDMWGDIAV